MSKLKNVAKNKIVLHNPYFNALWGGRGQDVRSEFFNFHRKAALVFKFFLDVTEQAWNLQVHLLSLKVQMAKKAAE